MDGLHEGDVRQHRLLVGCASVGNERDGSDGALDRVEQGQAGEDPGGHVLLGLGQSRPRGDVVGQRNLLRQPEVAGQAVPDLQILVVVKTVPVNGLDAIDEFDLLRRHVSPHCRAEARRRLAPSGLPGPCRATGQACADDPRPPPIMSRARIAVYRDSLAHGEARDHGETRPPPRRSPSV